MDRDGRVLGWRLLACYRVCPPDTAVVSCVIKALPSSHSLSKPLTADHWRPTYCGHRITWTQELRLAARDIFAVRDEAWGCLRVLQFITHGPANTMVRSGWNVEVVSNLRVRLYIRAVPRGRFAFCCRQRRLAGLVQFPPRYLISVPS
jgi:hypothetical protein